MQNAALLMVARNVQQGHCLQQIEDVLSKKGISYAPIKGAVLKNDYSGRETGFRVMCFCTDDQLPAGSTAAGSVKTRSSL